MNITHISVSRKKTFDQCQQRYKFQYHLKLPIPGPEPFYFVYGTIVHKIAELYVQLEGARPIGDICQDVLERRIPMEQDKDGNDVLCPEIPADYLKKLQKHIRAIQNLTDRIGAGGKTEHEFKYDLDPPNNRCVLGFIDRLIIRGNKAFIIDYKTTKKGKFRVDAESVLGDLQLRTYARVVNREFGIPAENIRAALYYLEGENIVAATYSQESLLAVEKELLKAYLTIENADPDKVWGNVSWNCKFCDYCTLCQFYNSGLGNAGPVWGGDMSEFGDAWAT